MVSLFLLPGECQHTGSGVARIDRSMYNSLLSIEVLVIFRLLALLTAVLLLAGCTAKPRVQVEGGASNARSGGRVLFSQPF